MRRLLFGLTALLLGCALAACSPAGATPTGHAPSPARTTTPTPTAPAGPPLPAALSPAQLAALPAAVYDAVVPGLLAAPANPHFSLAMTVGFDSAVYGADFSTPVARVPAKDFLGEPTIVVPVTTDGAWSLILTASRQTLPSAATPGSPAPAQTAAWIPTAALKPVGGLPDRIVVSVSAQTLTITDAAGTAKQTFPVGVGTPETSTPTDVTGYLQARYLDPAQGQAEHRIQLTSLHATGADEPYGGSDGGLIGIHYEDDRQGAISHGCIRVGADAVAAIDALPLGTPVRIVA
ncbi:L,D-transpeptidase [Leifsonia naganoensis]|uniref:Lipoprotein-anchoring transpeptidase ErfK/SrfK n=1 Tax=Leifsonia naganoensis TaxID=150025 RepID=A0A853DVD1_9MICO|nr:L,D-transpeptidase [Leifsonia naganoensis]NYK10904.1 lipoprotein-anchoring transpeptidase ErfK/SrfK [Leifsonia naganoensis]